MIASDRISKATDFALRPPIEWRIGGLLCLVVGIGPLAYLTYRWGLAQTALVLRRNEELWIVVLLSFFITLLSASVICSPKSWRANIQCAHDYISFTPNRLAHMLGEQTERTSITPFSARVLICQQAGKSRLIVRDVNGAEHEVGGRSPHTQIRLSDPEISALIKEVTQATGLNVSTVTRRQTSNGIVEEPWHLSASAPASFVWLRVLSVCAPLLGGSLMGLFSLSVLATIVVGLILWAISTFALFVASSREGRGTFPLLKTMATGVTFATMYTACFIFAKLLFHTH